VLVAYAYWGPKAGQAIYNMENADLVIGMVTILSGSLGTVVGGKFLDYLVSTIRNGFKVCYLGLVICCKHWKNEEVNSTNSAELLSKSFLII
jgi:hypothetical protein